MYEARARVLADRDEAGNGTRTRDPNLGKVVLYQLSYSREVRTAPGRAPWWVRRRGAAPTRWRRGESNP